jgi:DNA-binding transcriptional LysR family regulator
MDRLLAQHGLPKPRIVLDAPTWHGVREAALSGLGLAVLYRSVVRNELEQGALRVVEVIGHHDVRDVYLLCSPQRQRLAAPVFSHFVEILRREMVETLDSGQRYGSLRETLEIQGDVLEPSSDLVTWDALE